jgi:ATP-dependent Clp protease ATP-binding subunit ClpB
MTVIINNPQHQLLMVFVFCPLFLQPEVIDKLERKQMQLEVEATALATEAAKDVSAKHRLEKCQQELADLVETLRPLKLRYMAEKGRVDQIRETQQKLEQVNEKIAQAQRVRDTARVADLLYGAVPDLTKRLERLIAEKKAGTGMLSEVVGPSEVAEVVARWTGIPVTKLTSTDRDRLLNLAGHLRERVIGQDEAVTGVADAIIRSRGGMSAPGRPASFLFAGEGGR